jgi:phosphoglycolate phosphatase-like HAD superfamily hydrolase
MPLARGIAAVMIELDGTLLDTVPDLAAAAERMLFARRRLPGAVRFLWLQRGRGRAQSGL